MRLADLLDREALAALRPPGFRGTVDRWKTAGDRLRELGVRPENRVHAHFVPGRIEVVGKHTDYAGGRSLVGATEQGLYLAVAPRGDRVLSLHDLGRAEIESLDLGGELSPSRGHWTAYPAAVARRLRDDFGVAPAGADVAFSSSLPAAAGLASSSALVVAAWLALAADGPGEQAPRWPPWLGDRRRLAAYLAAVEAGRPLDSASDGDGETGVGTRGGSEDHTAILCSEAGTLSLYAYLPTEREATVELPPELTFAVAVSGVVAEKAGEARDAYNRAADQAGELAELWRSATGEEAPHLGAILARGPAECARLADVAGGGGRRFGGAELTRRLEQFVAESENIVPAAAEALAAGRLGAFGRRVDRSQSLAERLLGNQTPETVYLARSARRLGAAAASAFGAGFGGAVWALVRSTELAAFGERWRAAYLDAFPHRTAAFELLATRPGPGAFEFGSDPGAASRPPADL